MVAENKKKCLTVNYFGKEGRLSIIVSLIVLEVPFPFMPMQGSLSNQSPFHRWLCSSFLHSISFHFIRKPLIYVVKCHVTPVFYPLFDHTALFYIMTNEPLKSFHHCFIDLSLQREAWCVWALVPCSHWLPFNLTQATAPKSILNVLGEKAVLWWGFIKFKLIWR